MKKLITIVFAIILVSSLSAQTEQGKFLIGASSNLNFTSLSLTDLDGVDESDLPEMTSSASEFSFDGGYFVIDNLALGLYISSESSKLELEGESDSESSLTTYGVMARYYFGESGLFGEASYGIGTQDDGGDDIDISGLSIGVGYALFLTDNISVNPSLDYGSIKSESGDVEMKMGGLGAFIGISLHL